MKRSFTLLETVITLTILTVFSVSVLSSYMTAISLFRRLAQDESIKDELDRLAIKISDELSGIMSLEEYATELKGGPKTISFLGQEEVYSEDHKSLGRTLVYNNYKLSQGQLIKETALGPESIKIKKKKEKKILLSGLEKFEISYGSLRADSKKVIWKRSMVPSLEHDAWPEFIRINFVKLVAQREYSREFIVAIKGLAK